MAEIIEIESKNMKMLSWYKIPDIPYVEITYNTTDYYNNKKGLGNVSQWIDNNLKNKIYIHFYDRVHEVIVSILFTTKEDYIAFKLMFPEHCS